MNALQRLAEKLRGARAARAHKRAMNIFYVACGALVGFGLILVTAMLGGTKARPAEVGGYGGTEGQEAGYATSGEEDFGHEHADDEGLPSDFPIDFPILPGTDVTSSYFIDDPETVAYTVGGTAHDSPARVVAAYRDALKARGWRVTTRAGVQGSTSLLFDRGPEGAEMKDSGWLIFDDDGMGKTSIALILSLVKR